jgi:hypothetical protein
MAALLVRCSAVRTGVRGDEALSQFATGSSRHVGDLLSLADLVRMRLLLQREVYRA